MSISTPADFVVNDTGDIADVGRCIHEDGLACKKTIGIDSDKGIVSSHLRCLAEVGYTLEMIGQNLPGLHLGIRELLKLPGDFGQLISC